MMGVKKINGQFNNFVCAGDTIRDNVNGWGVRVSVLHDSDYHIDDDDMHSENQALTGLNEEAHKSLMAARTSWFRNDWFYGGVSVSIYREGVELAEQSIWGVEVNYPNSNNEYLMELANELLEECFTEAHHKIEKLSAFATQQEIQ
jgi:hypothetical protein|tara:strand:- start:223 stop:660 length:438 start_codon:yes stop_codon:yes gene_type:complete